MAIPLNVDENSLFPRLGKLIGGINEASDWEGEYSNIRAGLIATGFNTVQRDVVDNLYSQLESQNASNSGWMTYLSGLCSATMIEMALADTPPIPQADLTTALLRLRTQMLDTSQSINEPTVAVTVTAGSSNVGDGICVAYVTDATDGEVNPNVYQEDIVATCTADGYPGGSATQGQEPFQLLGELPAQSLLAFNWPAGSGANTTTQTVDPGVAGGIVTNGSFDTWTTALVAPTGWTVNTGTIGTTVVRGTDPYRGTYDLQFVGNGSELTSLRQTITLSPNTVYAMNVWLKTDGSVAAGVLNIRLLDQSNAVISDNASSNLSFTQNVNSLTSSYTAWSNWILTPAVLPDTITLEIRLSTAMTSTEVLNIDDLQISEATRLYTGGPYASIFTGDTPFATGDTFELEFTNSLGTGSFARSLDRVFNLQSLGIKIPTSSSPTIPDSLIQ